MTAPLVSGGVLDYQRYSSSSAAPAPRSFITQTPPIVFENSKIIAASHPNVNAGHPKDEGWFLSDFYAFNYLLKGLGSSQTWLTAADPRKLLRSDPPMTEKFLHGNPYQDRKVVLSQDLLDKGELTPVTVVQNKNMISRFLKEVRKQSEEAKRENKPLILFLFCHGLGETFILDHTEKEKGLTIAQLKGEIESGCRVTLITTACYSSGWAVKEINGPGQLALDATMLAAADGSSLSNAWQKSKSVGRTAGSIFASSVIAALASTTSPLLDEANDALDKQPLQPDEPTERQTATYNSFCQHILDVCRDRVTRHWSDQYFTFSAQNDNWDHSWTGRTGIPLAHFESRWNSLEIVPYTGCAVTKSTLDTDPGNPYWKGDDEPAKTAGGTIDEMTRNIAQNRVSSMAGLFLQTCPGDWCAGWGPSLCGRLEGAIEKELPMKELDEISATICFRWELALYADHLVEKFGLSAPDGQICILWDIQKWLGQRAKYKHHNMVWRTLVRANFLPGPGPNQGPPFDRFLHYMAAAVTLTELSENETSYLITRLVEDMAKMREFQKQRVIEEPSTWQSAKSWFKEIGRKIRADQD
ncbi:hypothetical protein Neosp_006888 [[Neocosmospora] mangrovei]